MVDEFRKIKSKENFKNAKKKGFLNLKPKKKTSLNLLEHYRMHMNVSMLVYPHMCKGRDLKLLRIQTHGLNMRSVKNCVCHTSSQHQSK